MIEETPPLAGACPGGDAFGGNPDHTSKPVFSCYAFSTDNVLSLTHFQLQLPGNIVCYAVAIF